MTPLAFTAPLALAIRLGQKTETRRPVCPTPTTDRDPALTYEEPYTALAYFGELRPDSSPLFRRFPNCAPGARRWIREPAVCLEHLPHGRIRVRYVADGAEAVVPFPGRLRPVLVGKGLPNGCHREAARTFVEIAGFRIEPLTAITDADAHAEGFPDRASFLSAWHLLYPAHGSERAPWVSVPSFRRVLETP